MDDDEGVSASGSLSTLALDWDDLMDQLLTEEFWLKTADDCNPSTSAYINGPGPGPSSHLHYFPCVEFLDLETADLSVNPPPQQVSPMDCPENHPSLRNPKFQEFVADKSHDRDAVEAAASFVQPASFLAQCWIGPCAINEPSSSLKNRLVHAIRQWRESTNDRDVLVQIWVPLKKGGKNFLTTTGQPYFLDPKCKSLASYRSVSEDHEFLVEEDSKEFIGLPGRVYLKKLPEWTPDVRFFRTYEYPRKSYAKQYNISGSLAVPVLEQGSGTCLGVVEVVTTSQKMSYRPELENICNALKAVDLRSAEDFCPPSVKACKEFCQAAVPEISEILGFVCNAHRVPLALTWARCFYQGQGGCQHFDENFSQCFSTVDSACFVADREFLRFHVACSEQYLTIGQGIAGRAFKINKQCFAADISTFSKTEYPLAHHAMMFGLRTAIAIPLRSTSTGSAEFVLEFFLSRDCQDTREQEKMWDLLPKTIKEACRSLHVVMDRDVLEEDNKGTMVGTDEPAKREETQNPISFTLEDLPPDQSFWLNQTVHARQKGKEVCAYQDHPQEPKEEVKVTTTWDNQEMFYERSFANVGYQSLDGSNMGDKRRAKTEKTISLEVLQRYFAGSLKDAAKSLGVCPTTLKRICRQHGIHRWPSRKIKKVGRSLKKLQVVIDSVQGAQGPIQIGSFYTAFPELTSTKYCGNGPFSSLNVIDHAEHLNPRPEGGIFGNASTALKSPHSSGSQSSGSSTSCSAGAKQRTATSNAWSTGDALTAEDPRGGLKRICSDAELCTMNHKEPLLMAGSRSPMTFDSHQIVKSLPTFPGSTNQVLHVEGSFKVKARFGEDTTCFSLHPNWGFVDLQEEIAKRFEIGDICMINLKYLDDEGEWVLLTCDADLEECKEIYMMSKRRTIKITLHQASQDQDQDQDHMGSS